MSAGDEPSLRRRAGPAGLDPTSVNRLLPCRQQHLSARSPVDDAHNVTSSFTSESTPLANPLADAEQRLERDAPGYLHKVRRASHELGIGGVGLADLWAVLADLRAVAQVNVEVPTKSRWRLGHVAKAVIRRLVGWYMHYLGAQVNDIGDAMIRFGETMVDRSVELEDRTRRNEADLTSLAGRVRRLEERAG